MPSAERKRFSRVTEPRTPRLYNIPAEGAFTDRLARGLLDGFPFGTDGELALARLTLLLPTRRAVRAMRDAFVRASGGALLLPRMLVIGDLDDELAVHLPGDTGEHGEMIDGLERSIWLMSFVETWQQRTGQSRAKVESWRLATALGRALDLMQMYAAEPGDLQTLVSGDLAAHWASTAEFLAILSDAWRPALAAAGLQDRVVARQEQLRRLIDDWSTRAPRDPIIAAGFANADPLAARLLRTVADRPKGAVVFPDLDLAMPDAEWEALHPKSPHPQAPLRQLLEDMAVRRGEVESWPAVSERDGDPARSHILRTALQSAAGSAEWAAREIPSLTGLARLEAQDPAAEALAIALAMRRSLATEGKTAALVTPDRMLARRVAAQLRRWGVQVDDSAGQPLALTPPGSFLRLALDAAASGFGPAELMALLKHPLAGPGDTRPGWLAKVRLLDLALRGVRPARGLQGVRNGLTTWDGWRKRTASEKSETVDWWKTVEAMLRPVAALFQRRKTSLLPEAAEELTALANVMSDERFWREASGRAASDLLGDLIASGGLAGPVRAEDLPALISAIMEGIAVRPSYGLHPRLAIYGLLEARLQRADLMILGGLNEGVWPPTDSFDPWLPPKIRDALGLPPTDRAIALSAHDFALACSAPEVLVTRARRDESAPAVASRFWLRLDALLGGGWPIDVELAELVGAMDAFDTRIEISRPEPKPPVAVRPRRISVTQVETLRADPYQFYARHILRLQKLDPHGEDAGAADRGTIVHKILERLAQANTLHDEEARRTAIAAELKAYSDHPLLDALWRPRVERMLAWASGQMRVLQEEGRAIAAVESEGSMDVDGVALRGKADVVLRSGAGLSIVDYKTGAPPSSAKIREGYADQLALLAWMAEAGSLKGVPAAAVSEIAYWRLSGGLNEGAVTTSDNPRMRADNPWRELPDYFAEARQRFRETVARWLTGDEPFTARLKPEYAPEAWNDYAQLARLQEWEGKARG